MRGDQRHRPRRHAVDVDRAHQRHDGQADGSFTGVLNAIDLGGVPPENILWNFPAATERAAVSSNWAGHDPRAHGSGVDRQRQPTAAPSPPTTSRSTASASSTIPSPAACRRRQPPEPQRNISLASLCTDPLTMRHALRLRNDDPTAYRSTGRTPTPRRAAPDRSGQVRTRSSTSRTATSVHHIVATSGSTTVEATTGTNKCGGSIVVSKAVTGEGMPPRARGRSSSRAATRSRTTVALVAGAQATVEVPGRYQPGLGGHRRDRRGL